MKPSVRKAIDYAPKKPGVYIFKNERGKMLYVGKSENLRNRLKSYLKPQDPKTEKLVECSAVVETVLTKTETEALILEDALVKVNQPRYNVSLRDDKMYPYIKITVKRKYPGIEVVRRALPDGSRYFGPYPDAKSVRRIVELIGELFGVRTCKHDLKRLKRPCIRHAMGKCAAPYLVMGKTEYIGRVIQACEFLGGEYNRIKRNLKTQIRGLSKDMQFEKAIELKTILESIESISKVQDVSSVKLHDMDVLGYGQYEGKSNITQLKVRNHRVVALIHYPLKGEYSESPTQSTKAFIKQHYTTADLIPKIIITSCEPDDRELLEKNLSGISGAKTQISFARRGRKHKLVEMAVKNSLHQLKQKKLERDTTGRLEVLKRYLKLSQIPERIEGYDISNIGEKHTVGGMVVFTNGKADKSQYRRFEIRGAVTQDDPANMAQMIRRRFNHPEWRAPDLVLLDGGRGQLNACLKHIPPGIATIALAKKDEELYLPHERDSIRPRKNNPALLALKEIRDEAHRFSRAYHRKKRSRGFVAKE